MKIAWLGVLISLGLIIWWWPKYKSGTIKVGSTRVKVEKAISPWEKARGLSGRSSLETNTGMLFVYAYPAKHAFWMNEMNFDLDFIFISGDKVVDIKENVPAPKAGESPVTIIPADPGDKILEVNAGFVAKHQLKIGDRVEY
jgi:uncharacterized membrane protein (UPF0127 family)